MRGSNHRLSAAGAAIMAMLCVSPVDAQGPPILPSTRVVQAGPASLYPAISLRDVGTDSNVYNDGTVPEEDFTYTVTPRLYAVVPIGNTRFIGTGTSDFVYYRTHKDQQSVNAFFEGRYEVVEARFRPFIAAGLSTHRRREGLEIDVRARQSQATITVGADVELTPITALTGWVRRETTSWDRDQQYLGVSLAEQLNYTANILAAGARFRLSPFTSIIAVAEIQRDRFDESPERDADSIRIGPTVEFENGGAFTGQARAGYRSFKPLNVVLPGYAGFAASAALSFIYLDLTRVGIDTTHDVKYSYDPLQPYYLESGVRFRVTQRIVGPFEVIAIGERSLLRHQTLGGTAFVGRRENVTTIGGGVGLHLGERMELTFTLDRNRRASSDPVGRNYERRRVLASASYGL